MLGEEPESKDVRRGLYRQSRCSDLVTSNERYRSRLCSRAVASFAYLSSLDVSSITFIPPFPTGLYLNMVST